MPEQEGYDQYNENDLLSRIVDGDEAAFRLIYEKYAANMYSNALRFTKSPELAKDITQDIFLRIWVNRSRLGQVQKFDSYLYVTGRNIIFNELKKQWPLNAGDEYLETFLQYDYNTAQEISEFRELEKQLTEAIADLPPQMQSAFRLSRFEGLTHNQIAEKMNISPVTSKSYIVRALIAIRQKLQEKGISLNATTLLGCFFLC